MAIIHADAIQKLYVAYFNRPADYYGLQFWDSVITANGGSTAAVAAAFAGEKEFKDTYAGMDLRHVLNKIYNNLFGHDADLPGLDFWVDVIQNKKAFTLDQAVTKIAEGAQNQDLIAFNAKVAAAKAFTSNLNTTAEILAYSGEEANAVAKQYIASVTDAPSLQQAVGRVDDVILRIVEGEPEQVPTFALSSNAVANTTAEGTTVLYTLQTTNVAAGTEYTYSIGGVNAADVVGGALTGAVKIDATGKAVIAITLAADATTEGLESMTVNVAGQSLATQIQDTSVAPPTFALTSNAVNSSAAEGTIVLYTLQTTNVAAGTEYTYSLGGVNAADVVGALTGTVTVDATGKAVIAVTLAADATTEGLESMTVSVAGQTIATQIVDTSTTPAPVPTFALTSNAVENTAAEGTTVLYTLETTNVAAGTEYTYSIGGVNAADIVGGALTGTVKIDANGKAIIAITLAADATTEGVEALTLNVAGRTLATQIQDTSTTPVPAAVYLAPSTSAIAIDEGQAVTFTIQTQNVAANSFINYTIGGTASGADIGNAPMSGVAVVDANGRATVTITAAADQMTEGAVETVTFSYTNPVTGETSASVSVNINDTSLTPNRNLSLSVGADTGTPFVAGSGNDTFNGLATANSLNSADVLVGGEGTDTVTALLTAGQTVRPTLSGIEIVAITNTGATATVDMSQTDAALTKVVSIQSTGAVTFDNLGKLVDVESQLTTGQTVNARFTSAALAGAADDLQVRLDNATGTTINVGRAAGSTIGAVESITVNSDVGAANSASIVNNTAAAYTLNLTGAADINVTSAATTVNAAGAAGTVTYSSAAGVTAYTYAGSAGADTLNVAAGQSVTAITGTENITLAGSGTVAVAAGDTTNVTVADNGAGANNTITLAAGNDTVSLAAGNDTVSLGEGNDRVVIAAGNLNVGVAPATDSINGGAGTDTLAISAGALTDAQLAAVREIEVLELQGTASATLDVNAFAAGIATVNGANNTLDANGNGLNDAGNAVTVEEQATDVALAVNGGAGTGDSVTVQDSGTASAGKVNLTVTGVETVTATAASSGVTVTVADATGVTFSGSAAADSFTGGAGDDAITAGAGGDTIVGGAGTDSLTVQAGGTVTVTGVESIGLSGAATVTATAGDATSVTVTDDAAANSDTITLGDGNDTVRLGGGVDTVNLGNGTNRVEIATADLTGGAVGARDVIVGGAGADTLAVSGALLADAQLVGVRNVETLAMLGGLAATLDANALAAGITNINGASAVGNAAGNTVTIVQQTAAWTLNINGGEDFIDANDNGVDDRNGNSTNSDTDTVTIAAGVVGATGALTLNVSNVENVNAAAATSGVTINVVDAPVTVDSDAAVDVVVATQRVQGVIVTGSAFADTVNGGAGADNISTGAGNDTINAGAGIDIVSAGDGNDTVNGGAGDDQINGGQGNDSINGGDGNDEITGGAGRDALVGGAGNDTFIMTTEQFNSDADSVDGGEGTDAIRINMTAGFSVPDVGFNNRFQNIEALEFAGNGAANMVLGYYAETANINTITATSATASLNVNGSSYTTTGLTITGNVLADTITGGAGADTLSGGEGNDVLNGNAGNDTLVIGAGTDQASGGAGNDTIVAGANLDAGDTINGGDGDDTLTLNGNYAGLVFGPSTVTNVERIELDGVATEQVNGVAGGAAGTVGATQSYNLTLDAATVAANATLTVDASDLRAISTGAGNDGIVGTADDVVSAGSLILNATTVAGVLNVTGGAGNDVITLGAGADVVAAGAGNDIIDGGAANDILNGEAGDDVLIGGAGNDTLTGGTGNDRFAIGSGLDTITDFRVAVGAQTENDVLVFNANIVDALAGVGNGNGDSFDAADVRTATNDVVITGGNLYGIIDGATTLNLANVKSAINGNSAAGGEILVGDGVRNAYILRASENSSTTVELYRVFDSDNAVNGSVTAAVERIAVVNLASGTFGDLTAANFSNFAANLIGTAAADTLIGTSLSDLIIGNGGADRLTGGAGADTFFADNSGNATTYDSIQDFLAADDAIDMTLAGTAANYVEIDGSGYATVAAAIAALDNVTFNGTVAHALVYNLNGSGNSFLISDQTLGGATDSVIELVGVGATGFDFGDII